MAQTQYSFALELVDSHFSACKETSLVIFQFNYFPLPDAFSFFSTLRHRCRRLHSTGKFYQRISRISPFFFIHGGACFYSCESDCMFYGRCLDSKSLAHGLTDMRNQFLCTNFSQHSIRRTFHTNRHATNSRSRRHC